MTTPLKARVLLADDHALLREAVRGLLDGQPDFEVVAEADDGAEAVQAALREDVDLAVLDISMPKVTGIDAARHITEQRPGTRVIMLTMHDSEDLLFRALKAGASGYVVKSAAGKDLVEAARGALRGEVFLLPREMCALAASYLAAIEEGAEDPPDVLSNREIEVLKLVAEGHSNEEIGEILVISARTVARHRANTLSKLGMTDRVELTRYAIRRGLVEP